MKTFVTVLIATCAAGWVLSGSAADAHAYYPGCHCGPAAPKSTYKTIHPAKSYTRYHDVSVTRRVERIRRITNVTRIQPIIHIHEVTRVHHHTIVETRNAYRSVRENLAPIRYVTRSIQNYYDCHCGR